MKVFLRRIHWKKRHLRLAASFLVVLLALGAGTGGGWWLRGRTEVPPAGQRCLRLQGFKYVSPLLACDTQASLAGETAERLKPLQGELQSYLDEQKRLGRIDEASVFLRDPSQALSMGLNASQPYHPASLNKVPVAMTILKSAEAKPDILQETVRMPEAQDNNVGLEIRPRQWLQPNTDYTLDQALQRMIVYSDNNAFTSVLGRLEPEKYRGIYAGLDIPLWSADGSSPDQITVAQFAYFLRILYNSTYLPADLSEKLLTWMVEADFQDGLVAGVPKGVQVAHKFGIRTEPKGEGVSRELHDCGIVYQEQHPYVLCVMTKGSGALTSQEEVIQSLSQRVYTAVKSNYQDL